MRKQFIIQILFLLLAKAAFAQCNNYHLSYNCRPSPSEAKDMYLSSQSRSVYLEAQVPYKFQMTLFGKMDYKIIFCAEKKFYPIHYTITEKATGKIFFDNKDDTFVESIGFSTDKTTIVVVECTLLAEKAKFDDIRDNRSCVGIPIMYRKIPKTGF
jgi:hypothetical protein